MTHLELLSPAKNLECGISAIDHGADAVYIGASRFGARAAAGNSVEDIEKLCQYAHQYGAKVFVTVNTIINDEELDDTLSLIQQLNKVGVDALLLQDFGLLTKLDGTTTDGGTLKCALHASTQTDNRTADKVRWLASMGFKRVVLARELSIKEIEEIHHAVPEVELEVFVHGALCVSYSGQCYASQYCFSRSANRGECAQFCRMEFDLKDANGQVMEKSRHLLSLRDMAQIDNLERLAEAGAVSFKIEGRLKDADYVKNITAAYSEKLNDICRKHPDKYQRASMGRCNYSFSPNIQKSFNRGFTTYFADGRQKNLVSFDTPKALGEPVGRVKELRGNSFNVASMASFANGDGLCFFSKNRQLVGFRVNRAEGNRLFPLQMPRELTPGTMLYRNHDQAFQTLLSKPSSTRIIDVSMHLLITSGLLTLTIKDEQGNIRSGSMPFDYQVAQKPQEENIKRQLTKLGGTIYHCIDVTIETKVDNPFIPSSLLAALRRDTLTSGTINPKSISDTEHQSALKRSEHSELPKKYDESYFYNASNKAAKAFYKQLGIDATSYENEGFRKENILMQCRYCLKAEMGYCTKTGRRAPWKEPLSIALSDGREFQLHFNCKKCEMWVVN